MNSGFSMIQVPSQSVQRCWIGDSETTIPEERIFAIGTMAVGDCSVKAARAFIQSLCLDIKADNDLHVQFVLASRYWY